MASMLSIAAILDEHSRQRGCHQGALHVGR
jgi:hypothetical protein